MRGFAYDEVNAVMAAGFADLKDAGSRLAALREVRPTGNFEPIAASFKRIKNILRQAEFAGGAVAPEVLTEAAERALHDEFCVCAVASIACAKKEITEERWRRSPACARGGRIFDQVLVNANEENVRRNRLGLLHQLLTELSSIADFSEIVTR